MPRPTSHPAPRPLPPRCRAAARLALLGGLAGLLLVGGAAAWAMGVWRAPREDSDHEGRWTVAAREDLVVSVDQPGTLEARRREIIRSKVRRELEITWMIEEGAFVETGDLLVRLDATPVEEKLTEAQQQLDNARSQLIAAEVTLENTTSEAQSNIEEAELAFRFAKLDLEKYLEGEYPQQLAQAKASVKVAEEDALRAAETAEASRELFDNGYITENEWRGDEAAATKARLDLEIARGELELLQAYTHMQQKAQLESDLRQTEAELERVRNRAKADIERARAELSNAQAQFSRRERDVKQENENLENCRMHAPVAGRVVYAPQGNRWRQQEPLTEGSNVRFNQEIIHLPESGAMSAAIKIQESQRDKVEAGMPVRVSFPSKPDLRLRGELAQVAEYLDPSGWWNNNQKVYSARVDLDEHVDDLRTGMNCRTRIIVASFSDVITVPLQSVVRVNNVPTVYVEKSGGKPGPRAVDLGLDNGRKVRIESGLERGERLLLTPPLKPADRRDRTSEEKRREEEASTETPQAGAPGQ